MILERFMKLKEVVNEKVENFLTSRKGKGKTYTNKIIRILLEQRSTDPDGWIRPKEFKGICCDQTLFRLLKDLESSHIIERKPGNNRDVYYRIPAGYSSIYFLSREELIDLLKQSYDAMDKVFDKLDIAKEYLKELGVSNPDGEIELRYESRKMNQKLAFEHAIKKGIENGTISDKPYIISPDTDIATNRLLYFFPLTNHNHLF
jgi:hypothetical protein